MKFSGDRDHATYRHELFLLNGKLLDGYSKHSGHDEVLDKNRLLLNVISRIVANGYLEKCYHLKFYTNLRLGHERDTLLVEMSQRGYESYGAAQLNMGLQTYLTALYEQIAKHGLAVAPTTTPDRRQDRAQTDTFAFTKGRFKKHDELVAFCQKLITTGTAERFRVESFYYKYMELFPETSPQKAVQNEAQKQIQALTNKFNAR